MVYNSNFVAAVKVNGKILRESREYNSDTVFIPFGSEYTILLKNLNSRKALVKVEVDGRTVIDNLIVLSNSNTEIERFFENDMVSGHKLRFIEKTDDIREFRGDKIEDGIIRISYKFEEEPPISKTYIYSSGQFPPFSPHDCWEKRWNRPYGYGNDFTGHNSSCGETKFGAVSHGPTAMVNNVSFNQNTDGITAEGEYSNQSFCYGNIGTLESVEHVINIQLKGYHSDRKEVKKPVTTKEKIQCKYCGKSSKSNCRFCPNCGSCLV